MNAHSKVNGAPHSAGQTVLVLQGGGALGAYQAGVYQALHEHGIEPDWVVGTSIGAINASLIAGNAPEDRLRRLQEFWRGVHRGFWAESVHSLPFGGAALANLFTMSTGIGGFFRPNPMAWAWPHAPIGAEQAAFYSTDALARTLAELVDFNLLNQGRPRVTVGAANVCTGDMHYFDSRTSGLTVKHIMASGAIPPAFPAVRIGDELYWDGGILSNTPVEAVFDDNPRRNSLVFAVHIWNPSEDEPDSLWKVFGRQKEVQYASRAKALIGRQKQIHKLRHIIAELARLVPDEQAAESNLFEEMASYGCLTRTHVVRLLAPPVADEDHAKDIDFSPGTVRTRWNAGYAETGRVLAKKPWEGEFDPLEGFILHECSGGEIVAGG
jgi:NTE family protein